MIFGKQGTIDVLYQCEIRKLMGSQITIFGIAKFNMKVYMENKLIFFYRLQQ